MNLYINSSLEEVGSNAFENKAADNVHISDLLGWCEKGLGKDIRALQYYLGDELIEDLVIPDGVTAIKQGAFNRKTFNTITIPKSVLAIDLDALSAKDAIYYEGSEAEWNEITLMNKSDDKIVFLNH